MAHTHQTTSVGLELDLSLLDRPLSELPKVGPKTLEMLERLGIRNRRDLLFHLPTGVRKHRVITSPTLIAAGESVIIPCTILQHPTVPRFSRRRIPAKVVAESPLGTINLVFFNGFQTYLKDQFPLHQRVVVSGIPELSHGVWQLVHPTIMPAEVLEKSYHSETIYPLTQGLRSGLLRDLIQIALKAIPRDYEWLDLAFCQQHNWPPFGQALRELHAPHNDADCDVMAPARQRVAFDEALAYQTQLIEMREALEKQDGMAFITNLSAHQQLLQQLPFELTACQKQAIAEIHSDMATPHPMRRLLHGDVGSGKTAVAAAAIMQALHANKSACVLSPTEILTKQHHKTLSQWLTPLGITVHCITNKATTKQRAETLRAIDASPGTHVVVGTHALLHDEAWRTHMGLVVVDEQHRFGVRQRQELLLQNPSPDLLMMSATPIPRTMLLTLFGDLAVSALKEKPKGRKDVTTRLISKGRIHEVLNKLPDLLARGEKVFWVCPLIEESEALDATDAETRFAVLRSELGREKVGLIHGRMKPDEKDAAFADFIAGKTRVLVATSVIEVGVDVPDANVLIIENAERYGLAQLHQLRGRVGRGHADASCVLLYGDRLSERGLQRLKLMRACHDGFVLAEEDLKLRQGGDVIGYQQSGQILFKTIDLEAHHALMHLARECVLHKKTPKNFFALWCSSYRRKDTKDTFGV